MKIYTSDGKHYGKLNSEDDGYVLTVFNNASGSYEGCLFFGAEKPDTEYAARQMALYLARQQMPMGA